MSEPLCGSRVLRAARRARELAKEPHAGDERVRAGRRVEGGHHVLHRA